MLTRRDLASGGRNSIMETDSWAHTETPWQTEVIELKRGGEKRRKKAGKLPDHKHRQAHTLYDPASPVMELSKGLQASNCHLFFPGQQWKQWTERADDLWPATAKKCGTFQWVTEEPGGWIQFCFLAWSCFGWLADLVGRMANCLVSWWQSRNRTQMQQ